MATDAPSTPPTAPPPRSPRWTRWLLVASLALNLLVLGLVIGAAMHGGPGGPGRHPRAGEMALGPVAAALEPPDKAAILDELRGRPELAGFAPGAREAALAPVVAALKAEPFDQAALDAALDAQVAQLRAAEGAVREVVVAHLAAMSPEARAAFADRLQDAARRGPGRD